MSDKRLYLLDATAFCYRAFYALRDLSTSFGQQTNAVYGFVNILNKILKDNAPEYLAVCFDVSRDTFRQKKFAEYKIQRPSMPEGLSGQMPLIREIISAYGLPIFEQKGFEADDIIATLAKQAKLNGFLTTIVSSDKDILQLVDDRTQVFNPYKDEGVVYDQQMVLERFGVGAEYITDIIALMGDTADNIPGVHGIGEKTAVSLVKSFGSIEELLKNIDSLKQEKLRQTIKDNADLIRLNKELAVLCADVELDFDLNKLKVPKPDYAELFRIFKRLEFNKFLKDLPLEEASHDQRQIVQLEDGELKGFLSAQGELVLSGEIPGELVFHAQGNIFRLKNQGENARAILESREIKKTGHDLKRLKLALAKDGIGLEGLDFDTMIAAYLLNPSKQGYGLVELAWEYLPDMPVGRSLNQSSAIEVLLKLKPALLNQLKDKELLKLFQEVEMPLVGVLARMELSGIKLDVKFLAGLSKELEIRLGNLIDQIYKLSECHFNINSPKQLREVLFEKLKLPVKKRTKTGPSTDEEVLRMLSSVHELPELLLEYRQLTKLKSTYIDALPEAIDPKTGMIHASFNQTGTETGRLSSSSPNLQNIPIKTDVGRKIRQAFIAYKKDDYIVSCDYSQIELRILAHISKDDCLIQAFKQDKDVHSATAALIFGVEEKDVTDQMRETAKRVNFGIIYGQTNYGLARDLGIGLDQAQAFIDVYFTTYAQVKNYIAEQIERAKKDGFVTTILGRRRYIPEINNKNQGIRQFAERQAVNTPIQGSASDLIKLAMVKIDQKITRDNFKSRMIMQIHDELVFNVTEDELAGFIELVRDGMEHVLELEVPVKVSIKKGWDWLVMEES